MAIDVDAFPVKAALGLTDIPPQRGDDAAG
jgi:hypothetical protein